MVACPHLQHGPHLDLASIGNLRHPGDLATFGWDQNGDVCGNKIWRCIYY